MTGVLTFLYNKIPYLPEWLIGSNTPSLQLSGRTPPACSDPEIRPAPLPAAASAAARSGPGDKGQSGKVSPSVCVL